MDDTQTAPRSEALAHLKFARIGPRKLRRVADAIRGKSVREALVLLQFSGVFASEPIEKLLKSAVANAENNHNMSTDDLFVTKITVDGGPGGSYTRRRSTSRRRSPALRSRFPPSKLAGAASPPGRPPVRAADPEPQPPLPEHHSGTEDSPGRLAARDHTNLGKPLVRKKELQDVAARRSVDP